jgi:hypothetical protein
MGGGRGKRVEAEYNVQALHAYMKTFKNCKEVKNIKNNNEGVNNMNRVYYVHVRK